MCVQQNGMFQFTAATASSLCSKIMFEPEYGWTGFSIVQFLFEVVL